MCDCIKSCAVQEDNLLYTSDDYQVTVEIILGNGTISSCHRVALGRINCLTPFNLVCKPTRGLFVYFPDCQASWPCITYCNPFPPRIPPPYSPIDLTKIVTGERNDYVTAYFSLCRVCKLEPWGEVDCIKDPYLI